MVFQALASNQSGIYLAVQFDASFSSTARFSPMTFYTSLILCNKDRFWGILSLGVGLPNQSRHSTIHAFNSKHSYALKLTSVSSSPSVSISSHSPLIKNHLD